eukprot:scaffold31_cov334-Pavlova_lutheri.AAC.13
MAHLRDVLTASDACVRFHVHVHLSFCSLSASKRGEHFQFLLGKVLFHHQPRSPGRQRTKRCACFVSFFQQVRLLPIQVTGIACFVHHHAISRCFFPLCRCFPADVVQEHVSHLLQPIRQGCYVSSFFLCVSQAHRNHHLRTELDESVVQALSKEVVLEVGAVSECQNRALRTSQEVVSDPFPTQAPPEGPCTGRCVSLSGRGHEEERPGASAGRHRQGVCPFFVQPTSMRVQSVQAQLGGRHLGHSLRGTALGSIKHRHGIAVALAIASKCVHRDAHGRPFRRVRIQLSLNFELTIGGGRHLEENDPTDGMEGIPILWWREQLHLVNNRDETTASSGTSPRKDDVQRWDTGGRIQCSTDNVRRSKHWSSATVDNHKQITSYGPTSCVVLVA